MSREKYAPVYNFDTKPKYKDIFSIKRGMGVYDSHLRRYGLVTGLRVNSADWLDVYVLWDGASKEEQVNPCAPNIIFT